MTQKQLQFQLIFEYIQCAAALFIDKTQKSHTLPEISKIQQI